MTALVKTKLAHVKEHPCLESLQHGVALLKEIHNLAATKAPTASFVGLCSAMAVLVVKSIACYYPDAVSLADTGTGDAGMSPQKKKKRRDDGGEKESVGSPIVEIYLASVENYMTKKRTRLYPSLFIDFCNKFPALGLQLLPKFAELIATTDTVEKGFKIVQGFNIMALCLQRLPVKENARYKNELIKFQKLFALALVEATRVNEEKGMTIARIKEIVKPSVTIIKRLKTAFTATTATATITGSGDVVNQNNNSVFADTKETIEGNLGDAEKAA
ncbi:DNA-directed DNA polymerase, partial [Physocladia obscura]